jgi:hypothetical protein
MARPEPSPRKLRRAGSRRIADLVDRLRDFDELREVQPARFDHGSSNFVHFHYHADGRIIADVRISDRRFVAFDVSEESGQQEVLEAIAHHFESRRGGS